MASDTVEKRLLCLEEELCCLQKLFRLNPADADDVLKAIMVRTMKLIMTMNDKGWFRIAYSNYVAEKRELEKKEKELEEKKKQKEKEVERRRKEEEERNKIEQEKKRKEEELEVRVNKARRLLGELFSNREVKEIGTFCLLGGMPGRELNNRRRPKYVVNRTRERRIISRGSVRSRGGGRRLIVRSRRSRKRKVGGYDNDRGNDPFFDYRARDVPVS